VNEIAQVPNWVTDSYEDGDVMITQSGNKIDVVVSLVMTVLATCSFERPAIY